MVQFDRIKFKFPIEYLKYHRKEYFVPKIELNPITGEICRERWYLRKEICREQTLGLNELVIDVSAGEIIIEISGKILLYNYPCLLSENTLEQALSNVNKTGLVELKINTLPYFSEILRADITRDLKLSKELSQYVRDFSIYASLSNYRLKTYKSGVEIYGEARSNQERLIIYSKYDELTSGKTVNKELQKYLSTGIFKDVIRLEGNLDSFKLIRKYFNISEGGSIPLLTLLTSDSNPVLKYFNNMFPVASNPVISEADSKLTFGKYALEKGYRAIIEDCGYNLKNCRRFVGSMMNGKSEPSYYMKDIKRVMAKMVSEKLGGSFSTIEEVRNMLES